MKIDRTEKSLIGEFYTVAQLYHREFVASPTLGKTKKVDILVYNPKTKARKLIEVKTTDEKIKNSKLFGQNYEWMMSEKHENIIDKNLFYCFVLLRGLNKLPRFFIVPNEEVADYVKSEHQQWLAYRQKKNGNPMRLFRIDATKSSKYEDNWDVLK